MSALPHRLDRTVTIGAAPETVFRFFTDSKRWAAWWGAGSSIDATPGGAMVIRYPNGVEAWRVVDDTVAANPSCPADRSLDHGIDTPAPMPAESARTGTSNARTPPTKYASRAKGAVAEKMPVIAGRPWIGSSTRSDGPAAR